MFWNDAADSTQSWRTDRSDRGQGEGLRTSPIFFCGREEASGAGVRLWPGRVASACGNTRLHIRYVDDERTQTLNLLTFKGGLRSFHKCSRVKGTVQQWGKICSTPAGLALGRGVNWLSATVTKSAQQHNISTLQNPKCRHGPAKTKPDTNKSFSLYVWMKQTGYLLMSSSCSYSDFVTVYAKLC